MNRYRVKLTLWLGFFLRLGIAFFNGFVGPTYGSSDDALGFHFMAANYSQNLAIDVFAISHIYVYI